MLMTLIQNFHASIYNLVFMIYYITIEFLIETVIAVAIGSAVYFYKNLKPFFKYTFPSLTIDPLEKEIWKKVRTENIHSLLHCGPSKLCVSQLVMTLTRFNLFFFVTL